MSGNSLQVPLLLQLAMITMIENVRLTDALRQPVLAAHPPSQLLTVVYKANFFSSFRYLLSYPSTTFMMCRRRHVRNIYVRCGHAFNLPEEIIQCEQSKCKFSLFHSAGCKPPICLRTCWQYLRYPEQHSPHIGSYCPFCDQERNTNDADQQQSVLFQS
ncbi:hypothetical protein IW262DRAFT_1034650 [Armillaria fumosa]|nr:hypothetical protein IW262DRAFT_1034650 [Armillaria fumosa]